MLYQRLENLTFNINIIQQEVNNIIERYPLHMWDNQLCLTNSGALDVHPYYHGCGGGFEYSPNQEPYQRLTRQYPINESLFMFWNNDIIDTYLFNTVYKQINQNYQVGRVRILKLAPKKCYSWHTDDQPRLHLPVVTDVGCMMVVEDSAFHMPADGSVYWVDTTKPHCAFNGSAVDRYHLMFNIVKRR